MGNVNEPDSFVENRDKSEIVAKGFPIWKREVPAGQLSTFPEVAIIRSQFW